MRLEKKLDERLPQKARLEPVVALTQELAKPALECLTITAIRKHRTARETAENLLEEWQAAIQRRHTPAEIETVHRDYVAAMVDLHVGQLVLSAFLDVLGYIPDVPEQLNC